MNTNKILVAGVVGGVASFLLGWLIYGMLLSDFMQDNTVAGVAKDSEAGIMWAIAVGSLFFGFLFSVIYGRWAGIKTLKTGATAGAVIGLLMGGHTAFISFGTANVYTSLTGVIVDMVAFVVLSALVGGVVGGVLGRGNDS